MDALTHVFVPLTVAYVFRQDLFEEPQYLALGLFGLFPDLDKVLGYPAVFHSVVSLLPFCLLAVAVGRLLDREAYGVLVAAFALSHLLLDLVEGGPLLWLYPFSSLGVGMEYPATVVFGEGFPGVHFEGVPIGLELVEPRTGHAESSSVEVNRFSPLDEYGVLSTMTFVVVYLGTVLEERREAESPTGRDR